MLDWLMKPHIKSLLYDVEVTLAVILIPTYSIKSVIAHKASNPFSTHGAPAYLPRPCRTTCSFCTGDYDSITQPLIRMGVCKVLMDLFSDNNRITVEITFIPVLVDEIKNIQGVINSFLESIVRHILCQLL